MITFTIIYDNNVYQENIKTGWGFSCLVRGTEKTILFDTGGDGLLLKRNLQKLGIDPKIVDIVFLSHQHGDHTDGLNRFLELNPDVCVYIPQSFPENFKDQVLKNGTEIVKVGKPQEICRGVSSTGELGDWIREQSLIIHTDKGFVLLTGCAHPGIVYITAKSTKLVNSIPFLIMGGFHLKDNSQDEIENISMDLRDLDAKYVGPCHCSGDLARGLLKKEFSEDYIEIGVGKRIHLEDLD